MTRFALILMLFHPSDLIVQKVWVLAHMTSLAATDVSPHSMNNKAR
jgi:hypothetical protein